MSDLLKIHDLAWENLESAAPTSISDMLVEISNHPGNSDRLAGALRILKLQDKIQIVLEDDHAAELKALYSRIQRNLQSFFDTNYPGFELKAFLDCIRVGTYMSIYVGCESEEALLKHAVPHYRYYMSRNAGGGWGRQGLHGRELFDIDERGDDEE